MRSLTEVPAPAPCHETDVERTHAPSRVEPADTWRVWVTDEDLRRARAAWAGARSAGAPPDRVRELVEELERMVRTVAAQVHGDPRATGGGTGGHAGVSSLAARRSARPPARLPVAG